MTEPGKDDEGANGAATKADINRVLDAVERARQQDSLEHGSIVGVTRDQNKETRTHVGNEIETLRGNSNYLKTRMQQVVKAIRRFLERHGMKADDLDD